MGDPAEKTCPDASRRGLRDAPTPLVPPLTEFCQTYIVKKPLGLRITKNTFQVTHIDPNSPLRGLVFLGDTLSALNGKKIKKYETIEQILGEKAERVKMECQHGGFSCSKLLATTIERVHVGTDLDKPAGRIVSRYAVWLRFPDAENHSNSLGLTIKYDSRERLIVADVEPGSLGSIHLSPGDVIKEVNDQPVSSITMFIFNVNKSCVTTKTVKLTLECLAGGQEIHDEALVADDAVDIAVQHLDQEKLKPAKYAQRSG
ncbi:unnamed protein product, partial [Mesorhabditis spiculigera]